MKSLGNGQSGRASVQGRRLAKLAAILTLGLFVAVGVANLMTSDERAPVRKRTYVAELDLAAPSSGTSARTAPIEAINREGLGSMFRPKTVAAAFLVAGLRGVAGVPAAQIN